MQILKIVILLAVLLTLIGYISYPHGGQKMDRNERKSRLLAPMTLSDPAELIAEQPVVKELIESLKIPMSEVQRIGKTVVSVKVSANKATLVH